jgi:hypothetical protein
MDVSDTSAQVSARWALGDARQGLLGTTAYD